MRLQKYLSAAGLCSRREAESRISAGRVTVNGRLAALGESVEPGVDTVLCDGVLVTLPASHTYIMLHKPRGYVTTLSDERGRKTVAELVADAGGRLYPVGRLDYDSEGLLILTDDGETANRLMHPSHGIKKTYQVIAEGLNYEQAAERLRQPMDVDGEHYRGAQVRLLTQPDVTPAQLAITIGEGKNREIRRMCAAVGLRVLRLRRVAQGELTLGSLPCGQWRPLTPKEIEFLQKIQ